MKLFKKVLSLALSGALAFSSAAALGGIEAGAAVKSDITYGEITAEGQYKLDFKELGLDASKITKIDLTLGIGSLDEGAGGAVVINSTENNWDQKEWGNEGSGKEYTLSAGENENEYLLSVAIKSGNYGSHGDEDYYANFLLVHWWGAEPTVKAVRIFAGSDVLYDSTAAAEPVVAPAPTETAKTPAKQTISVKTTKKTYKASALAKKAQSFKIGASAKTKLSYKVTTADSKKKVTFKNGKVTVKKGTEKGTYKIKVKITAKATADYAKATKNVTIKVTVK